MEPNDTLQKRWGDKVLAGRKAAGLSQQDLGHATGVQGSTISRIERGEFSPGDALRMRLAHVLRCSVAELFAYPDPQETFEVSA